MGEECLSAEINIFPHLESRINHAMPNHYSMMNKKIVIITLFALNFFADGKKGDPIEGMTLKKLLKRISNTEVNETERQEVLVEALGTHFMRTLHWLDLERWSAMKGRVVCLSGEVPQIGTHGQVTRKVHCDKHPSLHKFKIADHDGNFYISQQRPFSKCREATYTLTLGMEADHCLPNGFAEWGPENDLSTTVSHEQVDLGDFKYKKIGTSLKLKGKLYCGKKKDKYKVPKGDILEITKSPSIDLCGKQPKDKTWKDEFTMEKESSFNIIHKQMFLFCGDVIYNIKIKSSKMCKDGSAEWSGKQSIEDLGDIILKSPVDESFTTKKPKTLLKLPG